MGFVKLAQLAVLDAWTAQDAAAPLRRTAHRVDFQYTPRPGYLYVRSRAISSRCNDNHDEFPAPEIEAAWKTFLGKPAFVNHHNANHRRARGVIIAGAIHRDRNPDGTPDTWVELLHEIDAMRFPKLAKAIVEGRVNRTSMGVDVEKSTCSACGNVATSPAEYCRHIPAMKGKKFRQRNPKTGKVEESIIREICAGLNFFENSFLVEDPADPTAYVVGKPHLEKAAARHIAGQLDRPHPNRLFMREYGKEGGCRLNCTYGGTHCVICQEPVQLNLHAEFRRGNGWHHADGMRRDHDALPIDPEGVRASIPAQLAAKDRARAHVQDVLEQQGLPRRPTPGLPPDPFTASLTAHFEKAAALEPRLSLLDHFIAAEPLKVQSALEAAAELLDDDGGGLETEAALEYAHPADHPFFLAHPVSVDNLVAGWHDSHDEEKTEGKHWYPDGHYVSKKLGDGDAAFGGGMLSAYSTRTHWPANLFHAARSIRDGRAVGPGEGLNVMEMHQNSAARILAGEHHTAVLTTPKTKDFAHLLEHGHQTPDDIEAGTERVVVDRHALSAAVGRRLNDDENAAAPIKRQKFYDHVANMYRGAAKIISEQEGREVTPEHLQATLWLRQIRRNHNEDAVLSQNSAQAAGRFKGRQTRYRKNWERWDTHVTEHGLEAPPNLHLTPGLPHPYGARKEAMMKTAADEKITAPPYVDTLRQEQCPVCGESSVWTGQRCPVCGFVAPPSLFRDPDTSKAMEMRDEMENDPSQFPQGPADEAMGSFPDADNQLYHPDQLTPNGVPVPSGNAPDGLPQDEDSELQSPEDLEEAGAEKEEEGEQEMAEGEAEEQGEEEQGAALVCPECGTQFGPEDEGAEEGGPCPACGKGILQAPGKDQDSPAGGKVMAGSAVTAAVRAQQGLIESQAARLADQEREIGVLRAQLRFVAELAGVGPQLESIRKQADINNPGSPVPDPPAAPPTQTTEEALASGGYAPGGHSGAPPRGTGHTEDDPQRPGTTPGSTENVPAAQTTTAITPGVEDQTPPATELVDVTAPIQGTGGDSNPMPPIEQRRIETDVRVNPNPLAAQGPGIGGVGNDGTAFPWVISARERQGDAPAQHTAAAAPAAAPSEPGDASGARVMASMRLARLRLQAGLATGDDLEVCATIERDGSLQLHDIEHEIAILSQVAQRAPQRPRARPQSRPVTGARQAPAMAAPPQPAYSANGAGVDAEDIFLD